MKTKIETHNSNKYNVMMDMIFLFSLPGGGELIVIVFIVLLLFGGKKIPELMRGLGKGIREFNSARNSIEEEIKEGIKEVDRKKAEEKKIEEKKIEG
ncbi:MAG: twin-arginine translocase TatA/TatE family subunit [Saprospiraceae bacterium]